MPIYLFKSILSIIIVLLAIFSTFTMFELQGRPDSARKYSAEWLRKAHKINGFIFMALYLFIAYFCLNLLDDTRADFSSRAVIHSVTAFYVLLLLVLKVVITRVYRQFYPKLQNIGIILSMLALGMFATSGGYYLIVTDFGTNLNIQKAADSASGMEKHTLAPDPSFVVKTDSASIERGRALYEKNCSGCHDPGSNKTIVGPGHKRILKNDKLPVSGKPATPENVRNQLLNPYRMMPSFKDLSSDEITCLISYLNTL